MRLLHTKTLKFTEFFDSNIPGYAILSHRWGEEEVSFQSFQSGNRRGEGYSKIERCCSLAAEKGLEWCWIDTCCIDKASSAELSEAINSMFRWYQNADVCYAYISDVLWSGDGKEWGVGSGGTGQWYDSRHGFRHSLWFTRGWTLQELLAPSVVRFFDQKWTSMGSREDLANDISLATGIETEYISRGNENPRGQILSKDPLGACVAKKMFWASRRTTSRLEDMAYCLLGLFDVNMPLLYGEGRKAFVRLQLEIIRKDDDESIFAWTTPYQPSDPSTSGMLAPWPSMFRYSFNVVKPYNYGVNDDILPYSMTNKGLQFSMQAPSQPYETGATVRLALNCREEFKGTTVSVILHKNFVSWRRICCDTLFPDIIVGSQNTLNQKPGNVTTIYIKQEGL